MNMHLSRHFIITLLIVVSVMSAFPGVPHLVYGTLKDTDGTTPASATFSAYITSRTADVLTQDDFDCGYSSGSWQVQCGNFDNSWQIGDILHVAFQGAGGHTGSCEIQLTKEPGDNMHRGLVAVDASTAKIALPDVSGMRGNVMNYPVNITGITGVALGDSVVAYDLTLGFDPDVVQAVDATSSGTMTQNWGTPFVAPRSTEVNVASFTTNQPSKRLVSDSGILVYVKFLVHGDPGGLERYMSSIYLVDATIITKTSEVPISNFKNGSITVTNNPANVQKNITLYPGWNLVCTDMSIYPNTLPNALGSMNVTYVYGRGPIQGPQSWAANRPQHLNDLTIVSALSGYWMKFDDQSSQTWNFSGDAITTDIPMVLYQGATLIPFLPSTTQAIGTALSSIEPNYQHVKGYIGGGGSLTWDRNRPSILNDLENLLPMSAYEVQMTEASTLIYPGSSAKVLPNFASSRSENPQMIKVSSNRWCDIWGMQSGFLSEKDTVRVYDPDSVLCGEGVVNNEGAFLIHAFGDEAETEESDEGAEEGDTLWFTLNDELIDVAGTSNNYEISIIPGDIAIWNYRGNKRVEFAQSTSVELNPKAGRPERCILYPNYPNPFNPVTQISYELKESAQVVLSVINTNGQIVTAIFQGLQEPGHYTTQWNGRKSDDTIAAGGVYFIRLQAENRTIVHKCLLLK